MRLHTRNRPAPKAHFTAIRRHMTRDEIEKRGLAGTIRTGKRGYGFINALATKATYGRVPNMITGNEAFELFSATGTTEDEVKYGEQEAREYLVLARETQCPEVIMSLLESIVHREMERGSLSFFWTVCGAAYLG